MTEVVWPVVACLEGCRHFKLFSYSDSPHAGQVVRCDDCQMPREVLSAVSVDDLVRIVDRVTG